MCTKSAKGIATRGNPRCRWRGAEVPKPYAECGMLSKEGFSSGVPQCVAQAAGGPARTSGEHCSQSGQAGRTSPWLTSRCSAATLPPTLRTPSSPLHTQMLVELLLRSSSSLQGLQDLSTVNAQRGMHSLLRSRTPSVHTPRSPSSVRDSLPRDKE